MATSLKSEHERLIRVTKAKVKENMAQAYLEREQAIKALEKERVDQRAFEKAIRNEAFDQTKVEALTDIVKFGMSFKCLALFMIMKKYFELNLFDVNLTLIEGHDVCDLADGLRSEGGCYGGRPR